MTGRSWRWGIRTLAIHCAALLLAFTLVLGAAHAVEPQEVMKDPALEARARGLSQQLRCLVCQNQSIDDSNAELARDLRVLVRERLAAGDSDTAVLAFIEARYGEFVLLRPPFSVRTLLLWAAPLLLMIAAVFVLVRAARSRAAGAAPTPLSADEERRLRDLLKGEGRP